MKKLIAVAVLSVVAVNASAEGWGERAIGLLTRAGVLVDNRDKQVEIERPEDMAAVAVDYIPYTAQRCRVVGISDGDTFTCLDISNTQIKVRMNQIDAPESGQDYGQVAKKALSDYIYGREVALNSAGTDKYGRTLAEVYRVDDAENINKRMVLDGMAWAYVEYLTDDEYINLENQARISRAGLWAQGNAVYPSVYRQIQRENSATKSAKKATNNTPTYVSATPSQPKTKKSNSSNQLFSQPKSSSKYGACGTKRTCSAMSSCSEARYYLNTCGVSKLDKDGDGTPCESLCR